MKNKTLIFTYIMFIITTLITLFFFVFIILGIFLIKEVPPVIIFTILTVLYVLLSLHYLKCIKYQKNILAADERRIKKLKNTNIILAFVFGFIGFTMFIVGIFPIIVLGGFEIYFLYFFGVCIYFSLYAINLLLINQKIKSSLC